MQPVLPPIRAARNALTDAVGAWLETLDVQGADEPYSISALSRPPEPGQRVEEFPTVAVVVRSSSVHRMAPQPVPGTREPEHGPGVALERVGELLCTLELVIYCTDAEQEDEVAGAIEQGLMPTTAMVNRLVLMCGEQYHGALAVVRYESTDMFPQPHDSGLWRTAIRASATIPLLRQVQADDLNPQAQLTVDSDGAYRIDVAEGTTSAPGEEEESE